MSDILTDKMSKRIHCLKFILALCIIFIHNDMRNITYMGNHIVMSEGMDLMYRISDAITMIAVPLFFFFAGYFLFLKSYSFSLLFKKKVQQILIPYLVWTSIIIAVYYITQFISITRPFFSQPYNIIKDFTPIDWLDAFWGKIRRPRGEPIVPQFWFLRDLFILICLSPILRKLIKIFPIFMIICMLSFFILDVDIFIVRPDALLFFCLGAYFVKNNISLDYVDKIKYLDILLVYTIGAVLYIFVPSFMKIGCSIAIFAGGVLALKLSEYLIINDRVYVCLNYLGKYSF